MKSPEPRLTLTAIGAVAGLLAVAGCGLLAPYPTTPRAPQSGAAPGPRVAICYNQVNTSQAEVLSQAQQECASGTTAEQVDNDWYLEYCPLLLPERVTFRCVKPPSASPPSAGAPTSSVPAASVPAGPVSRRQPRQSAP